MSEEKRLPRGLRGIQGERGAQGAQGDRGDPFMSHGAAYAVVFLFLLTLAIGAANLLFTSALVGRANANAASVTQLCKSGNDARKQQIDLWAFIIQISPPPPHETKAEAKQREHVLHQFAVHLHTIFAPRDCTKGTGQ